MNFKQAVKELAKKSGTTNKAIAERLGIDPSTFSNAKKNHDLDLFLKVCDVCNSRLRLKANTENKGISISHDTLQGYADRTNELNNAVGIAFLTEVLSGGYDHEYIITTPEFEKIVFNVKQ